MDERSETNTKLSERKSVNGGGVVNRGFLRDPDDFYRCVRCVQTHHDRKLKTRVESISARRGGPRI